MKLSQQCQDLISNKASIPADIWDNFDDPLENATAKTNEERGREIAEEALETINGDRQDQYGEPENNFRAIARLWTAYITNKWLSLAETEFRLTDANVADMMVLFKMARLQTGTQKRDSSVDLLGYALLGSTMRGLK